MDAKNVVLRAVTEGEGQEEEALRKLEGDTAEIAAAVLAKAVETRKGSWDGWVGLGMDGAEDINGEKKGKRKGYGHLEALRTVRPVRRLHISLRVSDIVYCAAALEIMMTLNMLSMTPSRSPASSILQQQVSGFQELIVESN